MPPVPVLVVELPPLAPVPVEALLEGELVVAAAAADSSSPHAAIATSHPRPTVKRQALR
jgi:hypothetical protein